MLTVLITGATGNVGSEVIKNLDLSQVNAKAAITDDKSKFDNKITEVVLNFEDLATYEKALENVDVVFLMRPPHMGDPKAFYPFIDAAKKYGVKKIVFLSLLGIQYNPLAPHGYIEKYIKKSGLDYVFLRPSFFMQNLTTTHLEDIKLNHQINVPAGSGKTSFIDARDIAAVAAKLLIINDYDNRGIDLTGSEALGYDEVAEALTKAAGYKITYMNPSAKDFSLIMQKFGFALEHIKVMKGIYFVAKIGIAGKITNDVEQILGRNPIAFEKFAKDYQDKFKIEEI